MTKNPNITIKTELGNINAELYINQAPQTVANFLNYLKTNSYQNTSFYRIVRQDNQTNNPLPFTVPIEVIQGGLGMQDHPKKQKPINIETTQETKLKHQNGTLSMGRLEPNSASSEFFICINDQPELDFGGKRNPDGQGFAAFGKVVSGMDIVKKIQQSPSEGQTLTPPITINTIELT